MIFKKNTLVFKLMASFIGTNKELWRYIGPRLRNLVQQITKKHKADISVCEYCGSSENLESAYIRGRGRNELIDLVANEYTINGIVTIDLDVFEEKFKAEHEPIEKSILILCHSCHRNYDVKFKSEFQDHFIIKTAVQNASDLVSGNDLLPIILTPSSVAEFKEKLLVSKTAEIVSYY